jgi:hypothetical protein
MNIYKDYLDTIRLAMSAGRKSGTSLSEGIDNFDGRLEKSFSYRNFFSNSDFNQSHIEEILWLVIGYNCAIQPKLAVGNFHKSMFK